MTTQVVAVIVPRKPARRSGRVFMVWFLSGFPVRLTGFLG